MTAAVWRRCKAPKWSKYSVYCSTCLQVRFLQHKLKLNYSTKKAHLPLCKQKEEALFTWSLSPDNMETLYCTRERTHWWRWKGRGIETEVNKSEQTGIDSMESTPVLCRSLFPRWYVFPLTTETWDASKLAFFLQEQSITKPAYLSILPGALLCLFTALRAGFLGQTGILAMLLTAPVNS